MNLVAHRGYASKYPENSMIGFKAAVETGCLYLELDVQITKDKQAVVIHDSNLLRTGGRDMDVLQSHWADIKDCHIGEADRFAGRFSNEKIVLLDEFAQFLLENPKVYAFVEIKEESVAHFGVQAVLNIICESLENVKRQCSLISFNSDVLFEAKKTTNYAIAYVLHRFDSAHFHIVQKMQPNIVICNYKKIPDEEGSLWPGIWDWFLYEIIEPKIAQKWSRRGVKYIETMEIGSMITSLAEGRQ